MKLGQIGAATVNGKTRHIWLVKWMPTKEYQVWSFTPYESKGWAIEYGNASIADCRRYIKGNYNIESIVR